jgi:DNA-binding MarR family transcriptional regulator
LDYWGGKISITNNTFENFTKEELLFVYLLKYNFLRDNYVVTELITEKGIQSALKCDLGHISRLLKKNEENGLVYRTLSKIKNRKRKQFAFFLTEEGKKVASELMNMKYHSYAISKKNKYIQTQIIE